jgi:hypothetical protein
MHTAAMLRRAGGLPTWGNQRQDPYQSSESDQS